MISIAMHNAVVVRSTNCPEISPGAAQSSKRPHRCWCSPPPKSQHYYPCRARQYRLAKQIARSKALAGQLVSARLVIADTDVHSVYPIYNARVARIIDAYLLDGAVLPKVSECPAD